MNKENNVYLIGSMTEYLNRGEFEKATEWRKQAGLFLKSCGIKTFDPTYKFKVNHHYEPKGIPMQNLFYIKKCDFGLANLECILQSPGSIFELTSFYVLQKPIIAFGKLSGYSHIDDILTMRFDTSEKALQYMCDMYCQ